MNQMEIFKNPEFGSVRVTDEDGKYLFCGMDVAVALGYSNPRDAIARHCRCVVKRDVPHPQNPDRKISMTFIPEGDIYRLIVHSKLPSAERFERWVFDEVLPTIRQHGAYLTREKLWEVATSPEALLKLCSDLLAEREKNAALREDNARLQGKAVYIHSEKDILKLVTTLIANTKGEGKAGDDFWVKAETLLYCALIGYIHYEAPTLIEFINAMEVREDDEEFKNQVDLMFDELEARSPKENAGAALLDACKEVKGSDPVPVGSYRGFAMSVSFDAFRQEYMLLLKGQMTHRATLGTDPRGNLTRIDNALGQMPQRLEAVKNQLDNLYQQQAAAKAEVGKPFPQEQELRDKSARLAELDVLLNMDGRGRPAPEAVLAKSGRPSVLEGLKRPVQRCPEKKPKHHEQEAR